MPGSSSERIGFTVETESNLSAVEQELERPFRIAVLGDFSGRGARGETHETPLAKRRPLSIDRDNFDDVLASVAPSIVAPVVLGFRELDDFHPDRIYERLPVFRALRNVRRRLADPATFAEAAAEFLGGPEEATGKPPPLTAPPVDLLEQILGGSGETTARPAKARDEFQEYLRSIVSPYLVPGRDPRQPELLARVDLAASQEMRAILHHHAFRSLESLWRGIYLLTRWLETDNRLQIFLMDMTRDEIAADLLADDKDLESTALYKLLVDATVGTPGAERWSVLAAAFTFGPETDDLVWLGRVSSIAKAAHAPWIGAADSRLAGCPSFADSPDPDDWVKQPHGGWQALRELPGTNYVGLAAPRFLLRLPYGNAADPCELFAFEELESHDHHESYLWGNPAIVCALLIGQAFESEGWDLRLGSVLDLDRLPQHLYRANGETISKPCAEILLTERAAGRILEAGLIPLVSIKGADKVRVIRFQSIADPSAALAGPWQGA